jgi:hypothetical protein
MSDKYKPPVGRLLEFYESDSLVEADEDTGDEAGGGDAGTGPDAGGVVKPRRRTRSAVGKQSALAVAATVSAVKAAEKKKRKRRATSPSAVVTPTIPTPRLREVESKEEKESEKEKDEAIEELPVTDDRPARRSESPAAKRQRELVEKTPEDALRRGLETQRAAVATLARMPVGIKPRPFRPKLRIPISAR